ncbi:MAG: XRE family transcriptional regulator [Rhodospirillaceae bacterium]|nr:MAG: XRE family transcriptional regulator [Rhodospirillaceae bacterium]
MAKPLPIYLLTLRKRWGLSQRELAFLLHISSTMLSKLERLERRPSASVLLAAEMIFGAAPPEVFPSMYGKVETTVMKKAAALYERLDSRQDKRSKEICRRLLEMIKRARPYDDRA